MVHGGGWFGGAPLPWNLSPNIWRPATSSCSTRRTAHPAGGYPESFEDVACDIHSLCPGAGIHDLDRAPDRRGPFGRSPHRLGGEPGRRPVPGRLRRRGRRRVDRFVGLAGPYDPTLYSALLAGFFGTKLEVDSAPWEAGSPYSYLTENPDMDLLLVHGGADDLVPLRQANCSRTQPPRPASMRPWWNCPAPPTWTPAPPTWSATSSPPSSPNRKPMLCPSSFRRTLSLDLGDRSDRHARAEGRGMTQGPQQAATRPRWGRNSSSNFIISSSVPRGRPVRCHAT